MKKYIARMKQITIASAISMVVYISTYWITSAFMNESSDSVYLLALGIYSLVFMGAFDLILIHRTYIKNSSGEENALQDFENGYWGLKRDIVLLIKREFPTFVSFALINIMCWIMLSIDKLIFSKRTITAVLLIFAPLNVIGVILPTWANSILGYLLGTILCFAIYLLELVLFRKKWYMHWNKSRR